MTDRDTMRRAASWAMALLMAVLTAACSKLGLHSGHEVEYLAFMDYEDLKYGLIDLNGNVLLEPRFDNCPSAVANQRFFVYEDSVEGFVLYTAEKEPKRLGVFNDAGSFTGDLCPVSDYDDGHLKYIDKDGNTVLELNKIHGKATTAWNFYCGRSMIELASEKKGFIDEKGKLIVDCDFEFAYDFSDDAAIVFLDNPKTNDHARWGAIDTDGKLLFVKVFDELAPAVMRFSEGLLLAVKGDEELVVLNKDGDIVKELEHWLPETEVINGLFVYFEPGRNLMGLASTNGDVIIDAAYTSLRYNGKLLVGTAEDGKTYILARNGERIAKVTAEGEVTVLGAEYKNYGYAFLVGDVQDGYSIIDSKGNKTSTKFALDFMSTDIYHSANFLLGRQHFFDDDAYDDDDDDDDFGDDDDDFGDFDDED